MSDLVTKPTVFEVQCIDRRYLNVYVPRLQYPAGILGYVHRQLGLPIASTAPPGKITDAVSASMRRLPTINRGERKNDRARGGGWRFMRSE